MTQEDATVTVDELRPEKRDPWYPGGQRDARLWVEEFFRIFPNGCDDQDTMLGWFANAIETGVVVASRDALSVEGREAQIAAIDAALWAVDQRIVAAYPETAVELVSGDEQGRHDYAAALYDAGLRFRPSETLGDER